MLCQELLFFFGRLIGAHHSTQQTEVFVGGVHSQRTAFLMLSMLPNSV